MTATKVKDYASLADLRSRADKGCEVSQMVCITSLSNLGADHLTYHGPEPLWYRHYLGLEAFLRCMIGEYGMPEDEAEADIVAEINSIKQLIMEKK